MRARCHTFQRVKGRAVGARALAATLGLATLASCASVCGIEPPIVDVGADSGSEADALSGPDAPDVGDASVEVEPPDPCPDIDASDWLDASYAITPSNGSVVCSDGGPPLDLGGDPSNCGACGHSCVVGTCNGGYCEERPFIHAPYATALFDLVDGFFYFTDSWRLGRAPADGGGDAEVLYDPDAGPSYYDYGRAEGSGVFVSGPGGVYGLDLVTRLSRYVPDSGNPQRVALTPSDVFWTNYADRAVYSAQRDGGGTRTTIFKGPLIPAPIVADDRQVIWASWDFGAPAAGSEIYVREADGGTTPIPFPAQQIRALILGRRYLYWSENASGLIYRAPRDAIYKAIPIAAVPGAFLPAWQVSGTADERQIYFAYCYEGGCGIATVPACGGRARLLLQGNENGGHLVVDDKFLYFGAFNGGVHRIAK